MTRMLPIWVLMRIKTQSTVIGLWCGGIVKKMCLKNRKGVIRDWIMQIVKVKMERIRGSKTSCYACQKGPHP